MKTTYTADEIEALGVRYKAQGKASKLAAFDIQKLALLDFWKQHGGRKRSKLSKEQKMAGLRCMAALVIAFKKQRALPVRRAEYEKVKQQRFRPKRMGEVCWVCGAPPTDRHHIIQLQHGGINSRNNVVPLCRSCHCAIHPWMKP